MDAHKLVMLIAVAVAIVVIAAFLLTVITLLAQTWSRINTILGVVRGVVEKTEVLEPVLDEINAGIRGGEAALTGAVERLKVRKGYSESGFDEDRDREPAGLGTSTDVKPPNSAFTNY
jgi:hypothetical protein